MANKKKSAFDPKKLFVICAYSREAIAEELNAAIEVTGSEVPEFSADDPRLTDKVCQDYVNNVYDAWTNIDETTDAEHQVTIETLEQFE